MNEEFPRALGVLGDPVHHSKSPAMHMAALEAMDLPHHYSAYEVSAEQLGASLQGARALGFLGLNLTIPHKVAAVEMMDEVSASAARMGAVNTVEIRDGQLIGHNTDAPGFIKGWQELGLTIPSRVMLLGSGGAARAIADGISQAWTETVIEWVSRRPQSIDIPTHLKDRVRRRSYEQLSDSSWAGACTLWVNATSVGLAGGPSAFPRALPVQELSEAHGVIDIVYPRPDGGLLTQAQAQRAQVQDGRVMLLWQGVLALEIWLGQGISSSALAAMRRSLGLHASRS